MAQYEVKLKASLDSSQVKKEINNINNAVNKTGANIANQSAKAAQAAAKSEGAIQQAALNVNVAAINTALTKLGSTIQSIADNIGNNAIGDAVSTFHSAMSEVSSAAQTVMTSFRALGPIGASVATALTSFNIGLQMGTALFGSVETLQAIESQGFDLLEKTDSGTETGLQAAEAELAAATDNFKHLARLANDAAGGGLENISVKEIQTQLTSAVARLAAAKANVETQEKLAPKGAAVTATEPTTEPTKRYGNWSSIPEHERRYDIESRQYEQFASRGGDWEGFMEGVGGAFEADTFDASQTFAQSVEEAAEAVEEFQTELNNADFSDMASTRGLTNIQAIGGAIGYSPLEQANKIQRDILRITQEIAEYNRQQSLAMGA